MKSEEKKFHKVIPVRLNASDYQKITDAPKQKGISRSALLRRLLNSDQK